MFDRRKARERDLEEEIQSHLTLAEQDRIQNGETPDRAAAAARREFGNQTRIKESARELWGWPWLENILRDLRFAFRTFARNRAATALIIFTLGAGIGANTGIFSILDAVLLRDPPYREPGRLVSVLDLQMRAGGRATFFDLYSDYDNWKKNSRSFEGLGASTWAGGIGKTLSGFGPARPVTALPVTADYFAVLAVPAALGRTFEPKDLDAGCAVVLSHAFWQSISTKGDSLIGKPLRIDDQACTVMGVMPRDFAVYPDPPGLIWTLMPEPKRPDQFGVFVTARLKHGVSMETAQAELIALHRRLHQHDRWGELMEPRIYPLQSEFTWLAGHNLRLSILLLFCAVSVVLLICCANVANLLLGQALARGREMAIRAALGSSRIRLVRQLLTEGLLLSVAAALVGVALSAAAVRLFRVANPVELPPGVVVRVDVRLLGFALLLSIVTAVLFGLAPAWRASRAPLNDALKESGPRAGRARGGRRLVNTLVIAEVSLTIVLLAGAGLLIQSVAKFASAPLGFEPEGLVSAGIQLPRSYVKPEQQIQFYDRLLSNLSNARGIGTQALSSTLPAYGTGPVTVLAVEGRPDPPPDKVLDTGTQTISPEYFQVMRVPLKKGRVFDDRDRENSEPVAIINETLAVRYFPHEDPLGKRIRDFENRGTSRPWLRVVGVVGDERRTDTTNEMTWAATAVVYRPWRQNPQASATLIARAGRPAPSLRAAIERAIPDPDVPLAVFQTVHDLIAKLLAYPRFRAILLAGFAGLALLLALVGLYGVLSRLVAQRTHEIGIRMALGAGAADVIRMVAREGMVLIAIGIVLGLAAVAAVTRLMMALLYGVSPTDPMTLALITFILLATAIPAVCIPALRATRVDPMIALRYE